MAANGVLDFQSTNKLIFRGANANVVIDTQNLSLGVGHQGEGAITSNLFVTGNAHVSTDLSVGGTVTATSFSGGGSALTALNATNIASGTLPVSRGGTGTTSSTGTGALVLQNAPAFTGDATFDTNTLKIDAANNRVGIGMTSPNSSLHVNLGHNAGKQHIRATQTSFASGDTAGVRFGTGTWDAFIDHSHGSKDLLNFGFYRNPTRQVKMVLTHEGRVGIGTVSANDADLVIKQSGDVNDSSQTSGIRMIKYNNTNNWHFGLTGGTNFQFNYNNVQMGYLARSDVGVISFTGQHRNIIKGITPEGINELQGLIVSANTNKYIKINNGVETGSNAITINESIPIVSLSNVVIDKTCFGVISASEDPDVREDRIGNFVTPFEKEKGDTRVFINSLGEGAIWVSNIGGSLESGDYITTSTVKGYGQKQDDDILHNYTVAKITMDCDFDPVTQPVQVIKKDEDGENVLDEHGQIQWEDDPSGATEKAYKIRYLDASGVETDEANAVHKAAFVGCTYHCG